MDLIKVVKKSDPWTWTPEPPGGAWGIAAECARVKNTRGHNIKLNATINVHPNCRHKIFTVRARHVKQF